MFFFLLLQYISIAKSEVWVLVTVECLRLHYIIAIIGVLKGFKFVFIRILIQS